MIKLIKSTFYNETDTKQRLAEFITKTSQLSMGSECKLFEEAFAKKQERRFAVFVNSGSSANLVLLQALMNLGRLTQGDTVGFSALTWPTNVMPIFQLLLKPLPLDCELSTLNVSLAQLQALPEKPKCVFLTNVLGFCDNLDAIRAYCECEGMILLEDNCESLGSRSSGRLLGNFGLASTFSFFVGHHLSTLEGGMICTDDEELYRMMVMVRAHGWDRSLSADAQKRMRLHNDVDDFFALYTFYDLAFNVRPTEIQGFLGRQQLQYWDEIVSRREKNFRRLQAVINSQPTLSALDVSHMDVISNFAVPVVCIDTFTFREYRKKFNDRGVEIRPVIAGNMTRQPFYKKYHGVSVECPNTDAIHSNGFYFGNNPDLNEAEVDTLISLLS